MTGQENEPDAKMDQQAAPETGPGEDLIIVALSGVQRFITESRSTADLRAASRIMSELAETAAHTCAAHRARLVLPSATPSTGAPNRIVALARAGEGADIAALAAAAVHKQWSDSVEDVYKGAGGAPATPGMPRVVWVCAPASDDGYQGQWQRAQQMLAARKRVQDFQAQAWPRTRVCTLSPRWPVDPRPEKRMPKHEDDALAAANWVKRQRGRSTARDSRHRSQGIASTSGFASAFYRRAVLEHAADDPEVAGVVSDLHDMVTHRPSGLSTGTPVLDTPETPVPGLERPEAGPLRWLWGRGGRWVYPQTWEAATLAREFGLATSGPDFAAFAEHCALGRLAASELERLMGERGVAPPVPHLAVLAQDLDDMGAHLGRITTPEDHQRVSAQLDAVARAQTDLLRAPDVLGDAVYAGGDDLLAFTPAATALAAAAACYRAPATAQAQLPSASSAVLFFHHRYPLHAVLETVRAALADAKRMPDKHALSVGYIRRSGARGATVHPWRHETSTEAALAADDMAVFLPEPPPEGAGERGEQVRPRVLSPRLLADVDRDRDALADLRDADQDDYERELRRLVLRHTSGSTEAAREEFASRTAKRLRILAGAAPPWRGGEALADTVRVGAFVAKECM
ncbi:type III-B CRISPR-associated protein Cas10/Cmr2 [Nocardiopsis sp. RSe5-2]|uniref:Type III-B CRISPR-associated protein Cas10/Cmr2 n=1 Tax=Nocardiopsis endophytica TaxID=3018445 RepID=A0ABT4U0N9_9ACTN|nr:type III-B CRISPR-associated protein Cas10/Cmr2 [Nocardiopsis endophytica]MDA2810520.1 type III-B CRISPR-associated protein Cas10/Cmr2 [Nocardiopsis endophytica]